MKTLLSILTLTVCSTAFAQIAYQDTLYINSDNKVIKKESADLAYSFLVRKLNNNNQLHGDIVRYYNNGQVYEQYTYVDGKRENEFSVYSESGQPLVKGSFRNDIKTGKEQKWFANGQLQYEVEYVNNGLSPRQRMINEWNEEGKQLIKDGKGFITLHYPEKGYFEEGNYLNGFKDGEWLGTYMKTGARYFIESYQAGRLIEGVSFDSEGRDYDYKTVGLEVAFKGGFVGWQAYLKNELKYPKKQIRKRMQANVPVTFIVEANGSLSEIQITKATLPDFDKEALRVLRASPRWAPKTIRGQKVRSQVETIIAFRLRFDERGNPLTDQQHRYTSY